MIILSTEIPLPYRRQSGYTVRYLFSWQRRRKQSAHVHRKNDALSVPTVKNGRTAAIKLQKQLYFVSYLFKKFGFQSVPVTLHAITVQDPCRNLYIPMFTGSLLHFTFNGALCRALCHRRACHTAFLPLQTPSCTLTSDPLKYIDSGISVKALLLYHSEKTVDLFFVKQQPSLTRRLAIENVALS